MLLTLLHLSACSLFSPDDDEDSYQRVAVYHTVKSGETVSSIAARYRVPADKLAELNEIDDPKTLAVGRRLLIGHKRMNAVELKRARLSERVGKGRLAWPVEGARLVSPFGPRRGSFHDGLDLAAPPGTPVYAASNGKVIFSGDDLSGYGNLLILRSPDGLLTIYAHNRKLLVSKGAQVKSGQQIAEVGMTGHAEGPHLHFEVRLRDERGRYVAIDPMPLLAPNGSKPRFRVNEKLTAIFANIF